MHVLDTSFQLLSIQWIDEYVVKVSLNRPEKRNALSGLMWKELRQVFDTLGRTGDSCRCILLNGNGRDFCSGIDIADAVMFISENGEDSARTALKIASHIRSLQDCLTAMERCPVPVVAYLQGNCIGVGIDICTAADVRICHSNTLFSVREVYLGFPADVGTLQRLPKIVGNQSWVRDVSLTGRNFRSEEALTMGLVSLVSDDIGQVITKCKEIGQHSPLAIRGTKAALLYARDHSVAESLDQIGLANATVLQSPDVIEAIKNLRTKNSPRFNNIPAFSRL